MDELPLLQDTLCTRLPFKNPTALATYLPRPDLHSVICLQSRT